MYSLCRELIPTVDKIQIADLFIAKNKMPVFYIYGR